MQADDLVFSNDIGQKRGGSADIAKATISSLRSGELDNWSLGIAETTAVKKFRFSGEGDKRAEFAVSPFELLPSLSFRLTGTSPSLLRTRPICSVNSSTKILPN